MIGTRPLENINHVCLADDYNRVISVLKPLQNLHIGSGLNSIVTSNGVSISTVKMPGSTFTHPFKVDVTSISAATVAFGRVYEEKVFKGDELTANLTFLELSSEITFDPLSGMELQLDETLTEDTILIALHNDIDNDLTSNYFKVCISSDIPSGYYPAHVVAELSRDEISSSWEVEQVLVGDYTFPRVPSIPFDITRYGDKWLIYLPVGSLIINAEDWTQRIDNLTNAISPIVGDWYEFNKDYNYINVTPTGTTAWGKVNTVSYDATPYQIKAHSWKISDGVKPLIQGSIYYEFIRPDAGDSNSTSRSIAVQGQTFGITEEPGVYSDYTLELHGFFNSLAPEGDPTDPDQTSYIYKIPVREYDVANEAASLRWVPYDSLSGGGSLSAEPFPFKVRVSEDPLAEGGVDVFMGRVYEYQNFEGDSTSEALIRFQEWSNYNSVAPGTWQLNIGAEDGYISIMQLTSNYSNQFEILPETWALSQGYITVRRLAKVTKSDAYTITNIEQIQMGDVALTYVNTPPFTVAKFGFTEIFYLPANSVVINGYDYTPYINGLNSSGCPTDWYVVPNNASPMNLYIQMKYDPSYYGQVDAIEIGTSYSTGSYELITIPIYDFTTRHHYHIGAINREFIRTDASKTYYPGGGAEANNRKSIDMSVTDSADDRTLQLRNFKYATANDVALSGDENYSYSLVVREYNDTNNGDNAEIKYAPWSEMQSIIDNSVVNNFEENFNTYLDDYWWDWYYDLSSNPDLSGNGFWVTGGDYTINYGKSIGIDGSVMVIDLENLKLDGGVWTAAQDFKFDGDILDGASSYSIGVGSRILTDSSNQTKLDWGNNVLYGDWDMYDGALKVAGTQVVTAQQAAIPYSDGTLSGNAAAVNAVINALRAHGLIAT